MPDPSFVLGLLGSVVVAAPAALAAGLGVASLVGLKPSERATVWSVYVTTVVGLLATACVFVLMLAWDTRHVVVGFGDWVHIGHGGPRYHYSVKFVFDRLSVPFAALSLVLCGTIGAFSDRYLHREAGYNRFFVLYSLFMAGMVIASLAGTIETLFAGWELVGLSSALLVAYYHERPAPVRNGLRVWVVYRISDAALLLAAIILHHTASEGDFDRLLGDISWPDGEAAAALTTPQVLLVGGLLLIAAAGKSALIPFSGWLPRAMEGPTPSSAVFYGSLSVHLGAYLLLRVSPLLDASPGLSWAVVVLGLSTAALAALAGRVQTDIKSALSFASLTQVGLIVAEIGFGWRYLALIHLLGHACLRTLQLLRAPSLLRDRRALEDALGERIAHAPGRSGPLRTWLYRFGLERGYLDGLLDNYVVGPFVRLFRWFDALERGAADALAGRTAPEAVEPQPQPEPMEQSA